MGDADATGRLLTTVQSGSQQLLRSCIKLAEALPVGGAAGAAEGAVLAGEWQNATTPAAVLRAPVEPASHHGDR